MLFRSDDEREKISLFTNVLLHGVISMPDVDTIYKVPRLLHEQGLDELVCMKLQLLTRPADLKRWDTLVHEVAHPKATVTIGMCGKYTELSDSYKSLNEALRHAGIHNHVKVDIEYIDAESLTSQHVQQLADLDAILVPGRIIGDIKEQIKEAILEGEIRNDREEAMALLTRIAKEKGLA